MTSTITVFAPIILAPGKTEQDLLDASGVFERDFVSRQEGVLRRELVRTGAGEYLDIVQFKSQADMEEVMRLEQEHPACHAFFAVMDMSKEVEIKTYPSLATYAKA